MIQAALYGLRYFKVFLLLLKIKHLVVQHRQQQAHQYFLL